LGVVTLILVWAFGREYLDERASAIGVFLLAIDPTFVFWSRQGAHVSLPLLPLAVAAVWLLWRWYHYKRGKYLVMAAFCLGLGLSTKLLFLWLWMALILVWFILSLSRKPLVGQRRWLWPMDTSSISSWIGATLALVLGAFPLLLYNLRELGTLRMIIGNASRTELYGVNNLALASNLRVVFFEDLPTLMNGTWFVPSFGDYTGNWLAAPAYGVALVIVIWLALTHHLPYHPKRVLLLLVLPLVIIVQSAVTITGLGAAHLMIVWPAPQFVIAIALLGLYDLSVLQTKRYRRAQVVVFIVIAMLASANGLTTWRIHCTLAHTGGRGTFSDSIYALARDLDRDNEFVPIALDWGLRRSVQFLTQGRVNPEERFEYTHEPGVGFAAYIDQRVTGTPTSYLLHSRPYTAFGGHREVFEDAVYRHRLVPVGVGEYRQRDGQLASQVYQLQPYREIYELPSTARPLDVRLGSGLELAGYELQAELVNTGEPMQLTLYWRASRAQQQSYKVFVHLLDETGKAFAQHDGIPMKWGYPTQKWQIGEVVTDPVRLMAARLPPGFYHLFVGMYDENSQKRLPLYLADQRMPEDRLLLAQIKVE
jgi:hypothetical protein